MKVNLHKKSLSNTICIIILFIIGLTAPLNAVFAQNETVPFRNEINEFKKQDSLNFPEKGGILFVGSSSFRMWKNLEETFKSYQALNRGFGGSGLLDASYYADEIIFPYKPRQIVIYSGENDIASDTVHAEEVLSRFQSLFQKIRLRLPEIPVIFISIKPSPSREKFMPLMEPSNDLIKKYLIIQPGTVYVDVYRQMLNANGKPRKELFLEDMLHMNAEGYAIWIKSIEPYLIKNK